MSALFLVDLAMHLECRPCPAPGQRGARLGDYPVGSAVLAPVYDERGALRDHAEGAVITRSTGSWAITVHYRQARTTESGFTLLGVQAYPVSLSPVTTRGT